MAYLSLLLCWIFPSFYYIFSSDIIIFNMVSQQVLATFATLPLQGCTETLASMLCQDGCPQGASVAPELGCSLFADPSVGALSRYSWTLLHFNCSFQNSGFYSYIYFTGIEQESGRYYKMLDQSVYPYCNLLSCETFSSVPSVSYYVGAL